MTTTTADSSRVLEKARYHNDIKDCCTLLLGYYGPVGEYKGWQFYTTTNHYINNMYNAALVAAYRSERDVAFIFPVVRQWEIKQDETIDKLKVWIDETGNREFEALLNRYEGGGRGEGL